MIRYKKTNKIDYEALNTPKGETDYTLVLIKGRDIFKTFDKGHKKTPLIKRSKNIQGVYDYPGVDSRHAPGRRIDISKERHVEERSVMRQDV